MRDDEGVKQIADIIWMKAEGRSTCIIVVANRLLRLALVLFKLDLLLQSRDGLVLGREIRCKFLEHRFVRSLEGIETLIQVVIVVGAVLNRLALDIGVPVTTASAGHPSARSIIRLIGRARRIQIETSTRALTTGRTLT